MLNKVLLVVVLVGLLGAMAGCHTANGFVDDLKWTGDQIDAGVSNLTK